MESNIVDEKDLEAFITGLKNSFDTLDNFDLIKAKGFQAQIAKAISYLRLKKVAKFESKPRFGESISKEDLKKSLLTKLEVLKNLLENDENEMIGSKKKFDLVKNIAQLREKINNF